MIFFSLYSTHDLFSQDTEIKAIQSKLLLCLQQERIFHIQKKIGHTIVAFANRGEWPELISMLSQYASSDNANYQQLSYFLMNKLFGKVKYYLFACLIFYSVEYSPHIVRQQTHTFCSILYPALAEQTIFSLKTRASAMVALISMIYEIDLNEESLAQVRRYQWIHYTIIYTILHSFVFISLIKYILLQIDSLSRKLVDSLSFACSTLGRVFTSM